MGRMRHRKMALYRSDEYYDIYRMKLPEKDTTEKFEKSSILSKPSLLPTISQPVNSGRYFSGL